MKHKIYDVLKIKNMTLSFAESCTGGALAKDFTKISGVSDVFKGSLVAYQDQTKVDVLGVEQKLIKDYTSVSEPVCLQMAKKVKDFFGSDFAISTTGWAGPLGGTDADPIGTVYFGLCGNSSVHVERRTFKESNSREQLVKEATEFAWEIFYKKLIKS